MLQLGVGKAPIVTGMPFPGITGGHIPGMDRPPVVAQARISFDEQPEAERST